MGAAARMLNNTGNYETWNEALASVVFPELDNAGPAYLSLDAEQRAAISDRLGIEQADFEPELVRAVAELVRLPGDGPTSLFERLNARLGAWHHRRRDKRGAPPVLPFLALLTVAAERMAHGGGMSENNFYGRLLELFDQPDPLHHLENGYRRFGERFWAALDRWLEDNDGLRGLPTAAAVGHRFVGLPISQVLVRAADRDRLAHFFIQAGFPPGAVIPPQELEPSFSRWITSQPCPVSQPLAHHWHGTSSRAQILESVSTALAMWDGHVVHQENDDSVQGSLALNIGTFPKRRIEFSPIVYLADADQTRDGDIKTVSGWDTVELTPFAPGIMRIGEAQAFDNTSLLEGVLEVKDPMTGRSISRKPRRLMIFRRVDHAGAYLEAEQVMLGEDVMIVTRNEPRLMARVEEILKACARPGWSPLPEGFQGIPEGWTVFRSVQIFANPGELVSETSIDLRALVPLTNNQLVVAGGYQLPGVIRGKWHRDALPEVRAISDDPKGFVVRLFDYGASEGAAGESVQILERKSDEPGALVISLSSLELEDGNYRVELQPVGSKHPVSSITIRVRSGDRMDPDQLARFDPADQFLDDPLCAVGASQVRGDATLAGALLNDAEPGELQAQEVPMGPHWTLARSQRRKLTLNLATVPPDSCIYTGAHRTHIEMVDLDSDGRPLTAYTVGTCQKCGLVRRFPSSHWRAKKRAPRGRHDEAPRRISRSKLTPVSTDSTKPKWDVVLDAVCHTGAGDRATFERLSSYAEPSALMVHHLTRTLFALAHIDVLRSPDDLGILSWEVSPSTLVPTARGIFLAGYWPDRLVTDQLNTDPRIEMFKVEHPEAPTSRYLTGMPERLLTDVFVGASAIEIAEQLPPLSEVVDALPRVSAPSRVDGLSLFDPLTAKWNDADAMTVVGAYRIRGFATIDVLRSKEDLERREMAISTVHLGKHATALLWGSKPLLAYEHDDQILKVPLGANLPGLYERAAVLASGMAPFPNGGSLCYPFVSPELAGHLAYLLSH